jgi:hypothetical protein
MLLLLPPLLFIWKLLDTAIVLLHGFSSLLEAACV